MIYDSVIWKKDLNTEVEGIKLFFKNVDLNYDEEFEESSDPNVEEREMLHVAFIKLQKFSIYSSIIIRKLIEANRISGELIGYNSPIKYFEKLDIKR